MTNPLGKLDINELLARITANATAAVQATNSQGQGNGLLPRNKSNVDPAYVSFMDAMDLAYGLKSAQPGALKFVDVQGSKQLSDVFVVPPKVLANPGHDHPKLAVALYPKAGSKNVTGSDSYHAPLFVRDVDRWQFAKERIGKYTIDGKLGAKPGEEMFDETRTLSSILGQLDLPLKDSTPVVEALAILPISSDGSFNTEFVPNIRFDIGDHDHYKVALISQNKVSVFSQLIQGRSVFDVHNVEHDQSTHNFSTEFIPDMDDFSKMLVPSSAGHMILIVTPIDKPKPVIDFRTDFGYGGGDYNMRGGGSPFMMGGGALKGGSIGGVDIGIGSKVGSGSLYSGELTNSRNGNATIFHLRVLGVKPDGFEKLAANSAGLNSALDAFSSN